MDALEDARYQKIMEILEFAADHYRWNMTYKADLKQVRVVKDRLDKRSVEVIEALYESLSKKNPDRGILFDMVMNVAANDVTVMETIFFESSLRTGAPPTLLLNGLREYDGLLPIMEDYSKSTGRVRKQVVALLTAASTVTREFRSKRYEDFGALPLKEVKNADTSSVKFMGDELVQCIIDNPERADQIGRIILERQTSDPELIMSIIHSDVRSLSEGTL